MIDSLRKPCNTAFNGDAVPDSWKTSVIIPVHIDKGERAEIYVGVLVDGIRIVTKGLIEIGQGSFRSDLMLEYVKGIGEFLALRICIRGIRYRRR